MFCVLNGGNKLNPILHINMFEVYKQQSKLEQNTISKTSYLGLRFARFKLPGVERILLLNSSLPVAMLLNKQGFVLFYNHNFIF